MSTSAHYWSRGEKPKPEHFWIVLLGAGVIKCQQERLDLLCNKIHVHVSASAAGKNELENISCQQNGLSLMFGSGAGAAERFSGSSHGPVTCYCWAALASAKVWMRAWTVVCARVSPWVAGCRSPFFCSVAAGINSNPFRGNVGIANGWMDGWVLDCWLYKNKLHRDAYVCSLFFNIVCCLLKGRIDNCIQRKTRLINRENNGKLQPGRALCATMPLSLIVDSGKDALDFHDPFFSMQLLVVC